MKAVVTDGGIDGIPTVAVRPEPKPQAHDLLVRVRAAGLNNGDLAQVRGHYPAPAGSPPEIPGLELAGEVIALGPMVTRFALGDPVMAVVGGGAQAELAVVHERLAIPVPEGLDWAEAGGFPEAFTTAHDALFSQAGLGMGERVCVHGACGGVGTAGVQLAAAAGAHVVATVRQASQRAAVEALGADVSAVDPTGFGHHGPFDVILELIGGPNLAEDVDSLAPGGRITVIGVGAGGHAEINLVALMLRRGRIQASTLRSRPLEQKAQAARLVEQHVSPFLADGRVKVPVSETFSLENAPMAYRQFAEGGKFGKIVLLP